MRSLSLALTFLLPHAFAAEPTIAAGGASSFALDGNGRVFGWGANERGQLGIPSPRFMKKPALVMSHIRTISTGSSRFATGSDLNSLTAISESGRHDPMAACYQRLGSAMASQPALASTHFRYVGL